MYIEAHQDLNWAKMDIERNLNKYDLPIIQRQDIDVKNIMNLIPYNETERRNGFGHFYLYDYMFTRVWNQPDRHLKRVQQFEGILSPGFSVYTDYPLAIQVYNTYRNRWCGRYWQEHGVKVIPTVLWSLEDSYEFCFDGVEKGSVISTTNMGVRKEVGLYSIFQKGFKEMIKRLEPKHILFYGKITDDLLPYKDIMTCYTPYYDCFREDVEELK